MKKNLILLALSAVLASCSSTKLAQNNVPNDDVYYSKATAKEQPILEVRETSIKQDPYYSTDDSYYQGYYDGSYASRLNRFYHGSVGRSYYNDYYGYNSWYNPGLSITLGYGSRYSDPFYSYGYGSPFSSGYFYTPYYFGSRYGGYTSYNSSFPGYSYGGGYYSPGYYTPENSRTRPNREFSNGRSNAGNSTNTPYTGRPQRAGTTPSNGSPADRVSSQPSGNSSSAGQSRPERTQATPVQQQQPSSSQSRPERVSQPSTNSNPSSSPSSSPSSPPSSSGSRPSRGGR